MSGDSVVIEYEVTTEDLVADRRYWWDHVQPFYRRWFGGLSGIAILAFWAVVAIWLDYEWLAPLPILVLLFVRRFVDRRRYLARARQFLASQPAFGRGRHRLEASPLGLTVSVPGEGQITSTWAGIERVAKTPDHTIIYLANESVSLEIATASVEPAGGHEAMLETIQRSVAAAAPGDLPARNAQPIESVEFVRRTRDLIPVRWKRRLLAGGSYVVLICAVTVAVLWGAYSRDHEGSPPAPDVLGAIGIGVGFALVFNIGALAIARIEAAAATARLVGPRTARLEMDALVFQEPATHYVTRWSGVASVEMTRFGVFFKIPYGGGYAIPRRAFADDAAIQRFVALAAERIAAARAERTSL